MISIRAINRQPGWLGVEGPCNGATLLASHSLVGTGLISWVPSLRPPPPKQRGAPWEYSWRPGVFSQVPLFLVDSLKRQCLLRLAQPFAYL